MQKKKKVAHYCSKLLGLDQWKRLNVIGIPQISDTLKIFFRYLLFAFYALFSDHLGYSQAIWTEWMILWPLCETV